VGEVLLLGQKTACGPVARRESARAPSGHDLARQRADPIGDRLREVGVDQVGRSNAVGIEEQDPLARGEARSRIARVGGRALAACVHDGQPEKQRGGARVVGQDQLVTGHGGDLE
jgi:hypothetical protein